MNVPDIEIYSSPFCGYCARAKSLLRSKGAPFREIDIYADDSSRDEMIERSGGRRTVPQIFIAGEHIGGCDELYALEAAGRLDAKLAT